LARIFVNLRQSDDNSDMVAAVQMAFVEFPVVIQGTVGQRQEALEEVLIPGLFALCSEFPGMVGVLEVTPTLVKAAVPGVEALLGRKGTANSGRERWGTD
jgi:hypothetical protein